MDTGKGSLRLNTHTHTHIFVYIYLHKYIYAECVWHLFSVLLIESACQVSLVLELLERTHTHTHIYTMAPLTLKGWWLCEVANFNINQVGQHSQNKAKKRRGRRRYRKHKKITTYFAATTTTKGKCQTLTQLKALITNEHTYSIPLSGHLHHHHPIIKTITTTDSPSKL